MSIYLILFIAFFEIGICSFGGGYAALPFIENQTVRVHGWLTMSEYMDIVAISGMTPGPIALNASTFVGMKTAGLPGAIAATAGCVAPSCLIVSILAWCLAKYGNTGIMKEIMNGLRPSSAGLIGAAGLSIIISAIWTSKAIEIQSADWISAALIIGSIIALRKKAGQIAVISSCGAVSLIIYFIRSFF